MRVKLEDVCERGSSNLKQSDIIDKTGEYPIYGAAGYIGNVDFYHQEKSYVAVVKDGAGIGRTTLHPAKSSVIGTMQYLLPKENVLPEYLCYVVRYMHLEKYFTGATIPHIYFKDYKNEQLNLDLLDRQGEIVEILGKVESIIETRRNELQKLDELIKARFVELFSGTYKEVVAEDVCTQIIDCPHSTPKYDEENLIYPAIRTSEIQDGTISWESMKYVGAVEYEKRIKRLKPEKGDIVYAREGTYGDCVILPERHKFCLGQRTMLFRPDYRICTSAYLHAALRSDAVKRQADESNAGSTVPHVNLADAKRFHFPLPPIELQRRFADFVTQVDKSKAAVQKALDETQLLFDSLMQEYFG